MYKARFYHKKGDKIECLLCPRACRLAEGQTGTCGVREVKEGELYSTNYGCLAAVNQDPIEKKPLYHFYPGHSILSLGTFGCNLLCSFCQNWTLARGNPEQAPKKMSPEDVLRMLEKGGGPDSLPGVAYTYNEPLIWYEFVYDTARLIHEHGYKNVLVTNGYINREPLEEILPFIDAMNIDVKAFNDNFYGEYCRGERGPVIETVEKAVEACHVEITCLLIPDLNDDPGEQETFARWLGGLNPDLVLHYSRYFPQYKLDQPPTPVEVLEHSREIARKYLRYVFLGNIDLPGASDTICPHCGNLLIARRGYRVRLAGLDGYYCNNCRNRINLVLPAKQQKNDRQN